MGIFGSVILSSRLDESKRIESMLSDILSTDKKTTGLAKAVVSQDRDTKLQACAYGEDGKHHIPLGQVSHAHHRCAEDIQHDSTRKSVGAYRNPPIYERLVKANWIFVRTRNALDLFSLSHGDATFSWPLRQPMMSLLKIKIQEAMIPFDSKLIQK